MVSEKWLNLACGNNKIEHKNPTTQEVDGYYYGIDLIKTETADIAMDLESFPWDIESESAEEIICSHYVEHTPIESYSKRLIKLLNECDNFDQYKARVAQIDLNEPSDGLILFMQECYRILKSEITDPDGKIHGGSMKIIAPYYSSMRCWQDPTHRRAISEATFLYFNKAWREVNKLEHYGIVADFDYVYGYDMVNEFALKHEEARLYSITHYWNTINDIHVTLTKRKLE